MEKVIELPGKLSAGERCWVDGKPHKVERVVGRTLWDSDRIDDMDEFGREPGWYTELVAVPDALTAEEAARIAAEAAERAARIAAAEAEWRAYREQLDALREAHSRLVEGLEPADDFNHAVLRGLTADVVGRACEPRKGCSGVTELCAYRDAAGTARAVAYGCPYDLGPSYWIDPALVAESADKTRVWKWWNPEGYHADSYPGPGVPPEELTPEEQAEVARLEAARLALIRENEERGLGIHARAHLEDLGLVAPAGKRYTAPKSSPFVAVRWWLEFGPEYEEYLADYAAYLRRRSGDHPKARGLTIRVVLPPEAFARKGRKPAPVQGLPATARLHNFAEAAMVYEAL